MEELARPITLSLRLFGNMLAGTVMRGVIALLPTAVSWLPAAACLYFGFAAKPAGGSHDSTP